ncbi:MAG: DUF2089 domain-containing protein [Caldilineaceae bacterium]|nr:DUF2089 domain-containing protein [Caldilineaceae bacterium]
MLPLPRRCPFTGGEIVVTRIYCPDADTTIEGRFAVEEPPFAHLAPDQLKFVEIFVRNEGKLNRMEEELGLSYPTIRSRLHEIIRALGYEPGREEAAPAVDRKQILDDLDAGRITFEEAMQRLQGDD